MIKKLAFLAGVLFLFGNTIVMIGISQGQDIAISLSRPTPDTLSWNTPESTINAVYYGFYAVGGTTVILSILLTVIALVFFIKKSTK